MCPCDSNKRFSQCCWPYLAGKALAPTAESLMRSRYSAYSRANIAYIVATQTGPAAENFNANEAKAWAQSIKWLGLEVLRSEQGQATDNTGIVEFIARYQFNKQIQQLHEVSEFKKLNDRWYYCRTVL